MRSWLLWRSRIFNQLQSLVVHESLFHIVRDIDSLIQIWQERYLRWYMLASLIGWGGLWDEIFEERSLRERWAANVAPIVCFKRAWYVMQLAVCWSNWQLHVILLIEQMPCAGRDAGNNQEASNAVREQLQRSWRSCKWINRHLTVQTWHFVWSLLLRPQSQRSMLRHKRWLWLQCQC